MFKKGDKVRATMNCSSAEKGRIYEVTEGNNNGNGNLWINGGCHHWQSWELIESSTPKSSMPSLSSGDPLYNTATEEMASLSSFTHSTYSNWTAGYGVTFNKPAPVFAIGDRVQNVQSRESELPSPNRGKYGKVVSVSDYPSGLVYHVKYEDGATGSGEAKYYKLANQKIMKRLSNFIKKAVDADTQELIKAGFINGNLEPTAEGWEANREILWFSNHEALVKLAKERNAEAEKEEAKK